MAGDISPRDRGVYKFLDDYDAACEKLMPNLSIVEQELRKSLSPLRSVVFAPTAAEGTTLIGKILGVMTEVREGFVRRKGEKAGKPMDPETFYENIGIFINTLQAGRDRAGKTNRGYIAVALTQYHNRIAPESGATPQMLHGAVVPGDDYCLSVSGKESDGVTSARSTRHDYETQYKDIHKAISQEIAYFTYVRASPDLFKVMVRLLSENSAADVAKLLSAKNEADVEQRLYAMEKNDEPNAELSVDKPWRLTSSALEYADAMQDVNLSRVYANYTADKYLSAVARAVYDAASDDPAMFAYVLKCVFLAVREEIPSKLPQLIVADAAETNVVNRIEEVLLRSAPGVTNHKLGEAIIGEFNGELRGEGVVSSREERIPTDNATQPRPSIDNTRSEHSHATAPEPGCS